MCIRDRTIAELRKRAQLTQSQLSEKLGVSDKAVSKWERGLSCPDISLLNKLSIILDTDIESILYGYEVKNVWKGILVLDDSIESDIIIYDKDVYKRQHLQSVITVAYKKAISAKKAADT